MGRRRLINWGYYTLDIKKMIKAKGSTGGNRGQLIFKKFADSITPTVGEVVKGFDQDENNVTNVTTAAQPILGIIDSICDKSGNPIIDSTITAGTAKSSTVITVADTSTTDTYYCFVEASRFVKFSSEVHGTLGTTNYSDYAGCRIDTNSAGGDYDEVLETSATITIGTPAQFYSHGIDPSGPSQALASANLLISIAMSEMYSTSE